MARIGIPELIDIVQHLDMTHSVVDPDDLAHQISSYAESVDPKNLDAAPDDAPTEALAHLLIGARAARALLRDIELEAARQSRARGVTVRTLAEWAQMSERSAYIRYRRTTTPQAAR